jgi:hypothetical protein
MRTLRAPDGNGASPGSVHGALPLGAAGAAEVTHVKKSGPRRAARMCPQA